MMALVYYTTSLIPDSGPMCDKQLGKISFKEKKNLEILDAHATAISHFALGQRPIWRGWILRVNFVFNLSNAICWLTIACQVNAKL